MNPIYYIQGCLLNQYNQLFVATEIMVEVGDEKHSFDEHSSYTFNDLARRVIYTVRNGMARGKKLERVQLLSDEGDVLWCSEADKEDLIIKGE
jgi:hypothetical protein